MRSLIKKYLPVWVYKETWEKCLDEQELKCYNFPTPYDVCGIFKKKKLLDSPPYSADELLEVLQKVKDMPCTKVKKLYGEEYYGELYNKYSASEIIEKYRAYENTPKVGQMWKGKYAGTFAYVTQCSGNGKIYYVFGDGSCGSSTKDEFFDKFDFKVRDADETILAFLDKLKGGD